MNVLRRAKHYYCVLKILIMSLLISSCLPVRAFAGQWQMLPDGWHYTKDDRKAAQEEFVTDRENVYYLGPGGIMLTGWQRIGGRWYFLNPASGDPGKPEGAMLTGWRWINGRCYYMAEKQDELHPFGSMYESGITPDGFTVSESGAWTEGGQIVEILGKGILTKVSPSGKLIAGGGSSGGASGGSSGGYSKAASSGGGRKTAEPLTGRESSSDKKAENNPVKEETWEPVKPSESIHEKKDPDDFVSVSVKEPEKDGEEELPKASPSDAERTEPNDGTEECDVFFEIRFVDRESHGTELARRRTGTVKNGSSLEIGYLTRIIDDDGNIWEAIKAPHSETVYGPGSVLIYIEYELTGKMAEDEDPYKKEKETLSGWIGYAKEKDSLITGEDPETIFDERVVSQTEGSADLRLKGLAEQITDTGKHEICIIGKNTDPDGIILKEFFGTGVIYSRDVLDRFLIGEDCYTVTRFMVERIFTEDECIHEWTVTALREASCLSKGTDRYYCEKCGAQREITIPSLGHSDEDGDSVCDRCQKRTFQSAEGDRITGTLSLHNGEVEMSFVLADEDYQGGQLYISETGINAERLGGLSSSEYRNTGVFEFFSEHFGNDFSINGENLCLIEADGAGAYAAMLSYEEAGQYAALLGDDYVTRTFSGGGYRILLSGGGEGTADPGDGSVLIRPAVVLPKPEEDDPQRVHWNEGDVVARTIDGETYLFRCIDEDYSDRLNNKTVSALFLCESVIPAGYGGGYEESIDATGHSVLTWVPGPIASFGETNDYKYSRIRAFLDAETVFDAADIQIGVPNSFTGSTKEGKYEQLNETDLRTYSIGYQKMNARLYIFSVDEALRYKRYLWSFGGETDPESQLSDTCTAYWLRSPNGTGGDFDDTGMAYVVDLQKGNIHPMYVKPEGGSGDAYVDTQTSVGIRPVFTLPQR